MRGAFTGAIKDSCGRFEAAHGGTLFLDEIGRNSPWSCQSKLLGALQEKQYERVGDETETSAMCGSSPRRIAICKAEAAAGRFREDLYYRLNVFPVQAAPLRERRDDIPLLAQYFVDTLAKELKCPKPRLTEARVGQLQDYDWPGNIPRTAERDRTGDHRRAREGSGIRSSDDDRRAPPRAALPRELETAQPEFLTEPEIQRRERENLRIVLNKTGWKIKGAGGAAELLG